MKITLFRKVLLFSTSCIILFALLGFLTSFLLRETEMMRPPSSPMAQSFAQMLNNLSARTGLSQEETARLLEESHSEPMRPKLRILHREEALQVAQESHQTLPEEPYESVPIRPKPDAEPSPASLVRMGNQNEPHYLLLTMPPRPPKRPIFILNFIILIVSVALGSVFSLSMLFYAMRKRAETAREVMAELKSGNLKARIPLGKMDEIGHFILEFNRMADEIEKLVRTIKSTEASRIRLLQELAHDLRTPIASLKSMLETMADEKNNIDPRLAQELMQLSLRETEYFSRLVEDLLFLARVTEPRYQVDLAPVDIKDMIQDEAEQIETRHLSGERRVRLQSNLPAAGLQIFADERLIQRLMRNALENAFSHANSRVKVHHEEESDHVLIHIADDGPGLNPKELESFGEKRPTRIQDPSQEGRLSVGLGSVIMKAVMDAHEGRLSIQNIMDGKTQQVAGARLSLRFKKVGPHGL